MAVQYAEGDWFGVPLRDEGFAIGVIARAGRSGVLFGYFFGPRLQSPPRLADIACRSPEEAILVGKFGHLGLRGGAWPVLGRTQEWDRGRWSMPALIRYEELSGRSFKVCYADDDPNRVSREEQIPPGIAEQGPRDGLMGSGFVEVKLTALLGR